jgi:ubiquitin C-terminal hydrolase
MEQPFPLKNFGNTCWLNALLQSLLHIDSFRIFIQSFHPGSYTKKNTSIDYIRHIYQPKTRFFVLQLLQKEMIQKRPTYFYNNQPGDTQEAILALLELIHENISVHSTIETPWNKLHNYSISSILSMFYGMYETNIERQNQQEISKTHIVFQTLYLPILNQSFTLQQSIQQWLQKEEISEEHITISKKWIQSPQILTISFQHPTYTLEPTQSLQLQPLIQIDSTFYQLKSIIYFLGHIQQGGHYVAFTQIHHQWFLCNDEDIQPISSSIIYQPQQVLPIVLHYERQNTPIALEA